MFEDVWQGGVPSYPVARQDGVPEGVPGGRRQPAGPLPTRPDGAFFIDRDGACFKFVLNFLRDGDAAETARSAAAAGANMCQLAAEARYYGLDDLREACAAAAPPPPLPVVRDFPTLVAACGPGVEGADILALSQAELTEQLRQLDVKLVMGARVRAAVERERERVRAEERFRSDLQRMEVGLSEDAVRRLAALGFQLEQLCDMDVANARELGLSDADARRVDALQHTPRISEAALTFAHVMGTAVGQGTNTIAQNENLHSSAVGGDVLDASVSPVFWKATITIPQGHGGRCQCALGVIANVQPAAQVPAHQARPHAAFAFGVHQHAPGYNDPTAFCWLNAHTSICAGQQTDQRYAGGMPGVVADHEHVALDDSDDSVDSVDAAGGMDLMAGFGAPVPVDFGGQPFPGWQNGDVAIFKLEGAQLSMRLRGHTYTIPTRGPVRLFDQTVATS